jgi:hypothetical protein
MKTSTKIWLGLAAAAVALCVVNAFISVEKYKIYDARARKLVERLGTVQIETLDIAFSPETTLDESNEAVGQLRGYFNNYGKIDRNHMQQMRIPGRVLENIRIEGSVLYIENLDKNAAGWLWMAFISPSLEKIVIHHAGLPDEVIERSAFVSESEPAPEPEPAPAPESEPAPEETPAPEGH